jgi:lysozyme family protein
MKDNWGQSFELVLKSEGGYSNDNTDHGGETNLGVTRAAWGQYKGRPIHDGEMSALTRDMVEPFYKWSYWDKCRCDDLPTGVDYAVFDFAVNAGPGRAIRYLQRAVGVEDDGVVGPATMAAVKAADPREVLAGFSNAKENFYRNIVERHPSQGKFIRGWLARVEFVEVAAKTMMA